MFEKFLNQIKIIRTEKTYLQYKRILKIFEDKPVSVNTVLEIMDNKELSNNTKVQYLKIWAKALSDLGLLTEEINLLVKGLRMDEKIMPCPSKVQVEEIINHAQDDKTKLIVAIMAYSGLRISEVAGILYKDVLDDRILIRKTKNHSERYVPISHLLKPYLDDWQFSNENLKGDYLITSYKTKTRYTEDALKKSVKRACVNAGYSEFSCHSFRRFFATTIYKLSGYNLQLTAKACGHKSIAVTSRYLRTETSEILAAANLF